MYCVVPLVRTISLEVGLRFLILSEVLYFLMLIVEMYLVYFSLNMCYLFIFYLFLPKTI
jgi:hypothetical protein